MTRDEYIDARKRVNSQYFIDTKGKTHKFKGELKEASKSTSLHLKIAFNLFPEIDYPEDYLLDNGWILVGSTVYNCPIIHKKPTEAQIISLKKHKLFSELCFLYKKTNEYPNYEKYGALCEE